ncbi:MAG: Gfo/Idh/MocA family oxidoreductase [Bacteroidetes bacterium]|jgi:predicted dehydrogenase|nr:Gfo/Idh/MocA family oxidoreductase [Bacteroidota bacterium]MDA0944006.1 Gfo/Idh/MocA family oxidoreductase [Bacteroidota bacterium]MDA1112201.1 Gfo/Idh/MocA family oxidoreductase [Bacteroidota bacterium]
MVGIGIVGLGYWGPNLVRNFNAAQQAEVRCVADRDASRLAKIHSLYPAVDLLQEATEVFERSDVDAVVLATPINTHFELAKMALLAGKHVLVEKPLATSRAEVLELMDIADQKGLQIMVDHTFLYTGAVQKIKSLVDSGEIGDLHYFDSTRINLGLFNPNWSVIWDLAVHDLSIFDYISSGKKPVAVSATGVSHTQMGIEDIAYITLFFNDSTIAHITSSWISPVKIRKTLIGGSKKMVIYDDVEPTEKIKIYDSGFSVSTPEDMHRFYVDYRFGDISIPKVAQTEALLGVANDFVAAILDGKTPISDRLSGLNVVTVLEAAQQSLQQRGKTISLV